MDQVQIVQTDREDERTTDLLGQAALWAEGEAERWPSNDPPPLRVVAQRIGVTNSVRRGSVSWLAYRGTSLVARAILQGPMRSASLELYVRKDVRRRGIAKALLGCVRERLPLLGVEEVHLMTHSNASEGEVLAARLGGTVEASLRRVETPINGPRITLAASYRMPTGIVIELDAGRGRPESLWREIAVLKDLVSRRYRCEAVSAPVNVLVRREKNRRDRWALLGVQQKTLVAMTTGGECVGFSEYVWDPHQPLVLSHKSMGIAERYRGGTLIYGLVAGRRLIAQAECRIAVVRFSRDVGNAQRTEHAVPDEPDTLNAHVEKSWRIGLNSLDAYTSSARG